MGFKIRTLLCNDSFTGNLQVLMKRKTVIMIIYVFGVVINKWKIIPLELLLTLYKYKIIWE
jgi:hypothetical protein